MDDTEYASGVSDPRIKRARLLAAMLERQAQPQETQMVSGHAIPHGILGALAQAGAGFGARKFADRADSLEQQQAVNSKSELAKALQDYMAQRETDPRQAAVSAATSSNPGLMRVGLEDIQSLNKPAPKPTARGIQEVHIGDGTWQKFMKNEDGTVDMNSPVGQPYSSTPGATRVNTNVNLPGAEKKYGEEFGKGMAEADLKLKASAEEAPKVLQNVANVRQLLSSPTFTGAGADYKLLGSKVLQALGAKDTGDVNSNTELLRATLGQNTLNAIHSSGLGAGQGFTDNDLKFLQQVTAGTITLTPATLSRAADLQERAATQLLNKWNKRVQSIPPSALEGTGVGQIDLSPGDIAPTMSPMPATPAAAAPTTPPRKPRNEAEYNSLPPGSLYLAPDGSTRRKR